MRTQAPTHMPATALMKVGLLLVLHSVLCWRVVLTNDVFTDDHGHCTAETPFQLRASDERFRVRSVSSGSDSDSDSDSETLDCRLPFRAPQGVGICLHFDEFFIDDCGVSLLLYKDLSTHEERLWKRFGCHDNAPSELCTQTREITVRILKDNPNQHRGYGIDISIRENTPKVASAAYRIFHSTGFVILFIIAVIVILALLALLLYCCCCTSTGRAVTAFPSKTRPHYESHTLPSADRPWQ